MKESHRKGVATILTPSHARAAVKAALEALDRGICGLGNELRKRQFREPTASACTEGNRAVRASASVPCPAESKTPSTHRNSMRENREAPWPPAGSGRAGWRKR
jgi:hypothetical protein